jgi:hypothetical protein
MRIAELTRFLATAGKSPFEPLNEVMQIGTENRADRSKLDEIKPSIATFDLRYERLALAKFLGEFDLRNTSSSPGLTEEVEQHSVLTGVNRLFHRCHQRVAMVKSDSD